MYSGSSVGDVGPHARRVERRAPASGTAYPTSRVSPPVAVGDHGGLRDGGVPRQGRLDLAGLDPESADLHLVVDAAEEVEVAVRHASGRGRPCGTCGRRAGRTGRATNRSAVSPARPR